MRAAGGGRLILLGAAVILAGSVDPFLLGITLDRIAWIGAMSAGCAMVGAGLVEFWRGRK